MSSFSVSEAGTEPLRWATMAREHPARGRPRWTERPGLLCPGSVLPAVCVCVAWVRSSSLWDRGGGGRGSVCWAPPVRQAVLLGGSLSSRSNPECTVSVPSRQQGQRGKGRPFVTQLGGGWAPSSTPLGFPRCHAFLVGTSLWSPATACPGRPLAPCWLSGTCWCLQKGEVGSFLVVVIRTQSPFPLGIASQLGTCRRNQLHTQLV